LDASLLEREPLPGCDSEHLDRVIETLPSSLIVARSNRPGADKA
jgi:hypothetical protein